MECATLCRVVMGLYRAVMGYASFARNLMTQFDT